MLEKMSVRRSTFDKWVLEVDVEKKWLDFEGNSTGSVTGIFCKLCRENSSALRGLRNFSSAFIDGISGCALKKDDVVKHGKSDMHKKAVGIVTNKARTLSEIYKTTPIGKVICGATNDEQMRVTKLFDIAYFIAAEELPFSKFPGLVELEKRHGVPLGTTYHTRQKCSDLTEVIAETMQEEVVSALKSTECFSLLMDGSTDSSVTEKELLYVAYLESSGEAAVRFLALRDVQDTTAEGVIDCINETFLNLGVDDWKKKLGSVCMDGAAVNLGVRRGVAARLRTEMPWLVSVHCFNHRLELAAKDAFSETYLDEISPMLMNIYYMYHKSPKRLRDLQSLAEQLDETVVKPQKAHGTRWLQHKKNAIKALLRSYPVIVRHLEELAAGTGADSARFKAYLKQLKSFKFVSHVLLFDIFLAPLAALSLNLQCSSADLQFAISSLRACRAMIDRLKTANLQGEASLSQLLAAFEADEDVMYKGIKLSGTALTTIDALHNARSSYATAIEDCLQTRFRDLEEQDVFKAVKLLQTATWPMDDSGLDMFGTMTVLALYDHFAEMFPDGCVDRDSVVSEWDAFKSFWKESCSHLSSSKVWSVMMANYRERFPNLCRLMVVLLTLPVSNAVVERGFSAMRRIKTDWRCRLNEASLNYLMRTSIEGPDASKFDVGPAVRRFFSVPRRPNVQPYKRKHQEVEVSDGDTEGE